MRAREGRADFKRMVGWISAAVAAAAVIRAAGFVMSGLFKTVYPYALNLGEAPVAQAIRYIGLGVWPYHDLSAPPYSLVPYGPVYLTVSAAAQSLFATLPLAGGRLVCLAASVAAAVTIGSLVFGAARSRVAAVGAGCFFLTLPFVERWGVQVNVDMTAVALELAALGCFFVHASAQRPGRRYFWLGTVLTVLAVFTKSSALAAAAAWTFHLIFTRKWRDLALFVVVSGTAILAVFAVLNAATEGSYYLHTTQEIGRRLFFWRFVLDYWKITFGGHALNVFAAAAALMWPAFWRAGGPGNGASASRPAAQPLLNLYLLFTVLLTVSLGKQGSDSNYLLPFIAASTLALGRWWGMGLSGTLTTASRTVALIGPALALAIACTVGALTAPGIRPAQFLPERYRAAYAENTRFYDGISKLVRQFPGPVISWDMSLLLANGRPIYFEPFPMAQAAYSGVWDQAPILKDLRERKVKLIITYFWSRAIKADRNFTPEFVAELRANYRLAANVKIPWTDNQRLFFYVPKASDP